MAQTIAQHISTFFIKIRRSDFLTCGGNRFAMIFSDEITCRLKRRYPVSAIANVPDLEMKDFDQSNLDPRIDGGYLPHSSWTPDCRVIDWVSCCLDAKFVVLPIQQRLQWEPR